MIEIHMIRRVPFRAPHFWLYFFMVAGGLWHILGIFRSLMSFSAGFVTLLIGILCVYFELRNSNFFRKKNFILWSIGTFLVSFLVEMIGVHTGKIFGIYMYGNELQPQIAQTPIAIGGAWLSVILGAKAVISFIYKKLQPTNAISQFLQYSIVESFFIALLMTIFDYGMEPAAVRLGYWAWAGIDIPLQNYVAWFILGWIFAFVGLRMKAFHSESASFSFHAYWAQILYFTLIRVFV